MYRTPARRRPIQRINRPGKYYGMGPQVRDGVSGFMRPLSQTVLQRGVRVSARPQDRSLDQPDKS